MRAGGGGLCCSSWVSSPRSPDQLMVVRSVERVFMLLFVHWSEASNSWSENEWLQSWLVPGLDRALSVCSTHRLMFPGHHSHWRPETVSIISILITSIQEESWLQWLCHSSLLPLVSPLESLISWLILIWFVQWMEMLGLIVNQASEMTQFTIIDVTLSSTQCRPDFSSQVDNATVPHNPLVPSVDPILLPS